MEWYFQLVKNNSKTNTNCEPRFLYHVKISFTNEDEIKKHFPKSKTELDIRRPTLKAGERPEINEGKKE